MPMIVRLALISVLCLSSLGAATGKPAADCQIVTVSAQLDPYRASGSARGSWRFRVNCPASAAYTVQLSTPAGVLTGPTAPITLFGPGGQVARAIVTVPADLTVSGSRLFDLSILVPAGQWQLAGGTYEVPLSVQAVRLNAPAGDQP
ncbi:hypothetical protein [Deinococcus daejeonensis]|uniref:Uncharacterized protein n=1 Tax=Deinococcus daejeonensis TaxID=1007098 RepID=A0ABQ2J6M8_9DEIO|nr:hypothetical protein [Deinococcus daejeonensis]GGN40469.1 hypothetical protein GCM10010842_25340 [Deinococcus daejeonensis]